MNEQFLLNTALSRELFDTVRDFPIIDFHNHLTVSDVVENRQFKNVTELWVTSDPYKLRAMRILGVPERYLTGDADPKEKWAVFVKNLPNLVGNPMYDWTNLEAERVFGLPGLLNPEKTDEAYETANELLKQPEFSAQGILSKFKVEYSAPCAAFGDDFPEVPGLSPSLRTDTLFQNPKGTAEKLGEKYGKTVENSADLFDVLLRSVKELKAKGLVFTDVSLDSGWRYFEENGEEETVFRKTFAGEPLTTTETFILQSAFLRGIYEIAKKENLVVQLHMGAERFTSDRLRRVAGPAGGFAGIGGVDAASVIALLRDLENRDVLVQTILYTLNPADYARLSVLSGSFVDAGTPGFVQLGPAWWWCDHLHGMTTALEEMANYGVLSTFIGMTTDSRSLLSMSRHEYFRRVLCHYLGEKAERGELPDSLEVLAPIARKICYENAKEIIGKRGIGK